MTIQFADVIIPLPLNQHFTYRIPAELQALIEVGSRVIVQFGAKKYYSAIVSKLHNQEPTKYKVKNIEQLIDTTPSVLPTQLKLWHWISTYYICTPGEVLKAALPARLKLESESRLYLTDDYSLSSMPTPLENQILNVIRILKEHNGQTLHQINSKLNKLSHHKAVEWLSEKGVLIFKEKVANKYKQKKKTLLQLAPALQHKKYLQIIYTELSKAPKQLELLNAIVADILDQGDQLTAKVDKAKILKQTGLSSPLVAQLLKKEYLISEEIELSRITEQDIKKREAFPLNEYQDKAFSKIKSGFKDKNISLLHGVTSSGKTEVYIHLIQEYINQGKQVLYLLPEIALTTQAVARLRAVFGNKIGLYHSKFNDNERVDIWKQMLSATPESPQCQVMVGARSALFLPFKNLGLIVVDEEHESSYKQLDPTPRYNARDTALVMGQIHKAKVLLGSATPSVETYYNAASNKYHLVELLTRFQNIQLPQIEIADKIKARQAKSMKSHFTPKLISAMKTAQEKGKQTILFQNRRGYSPMVECESCGWVPKCTDCDVSLTRHLHNNTLVCHYCGATRSLPRTCDNCGSDQLKSKGFGTEKIEDEIGKFFPEARVARMDQDTTRGKDAYAQFISKLETNDIDILIGTQMVTKGLDFEHVGVVGVLNADNMLNFPDFRAAERAYQLMSQVAGRAGRKHEQGKVILQTGDAEHPVIKQVIQHDYKGMFYEQIHERKAFHYPPFTRLVTLTLKHPSLEKVDAASKLLADLLRRIFMHRVLGPEYPTVAKIQKFYLKRIWLKIERPLPYTKSNPKIREAVAFMQEQAGFSNVSVTIDVDPQ